jgi:hypothetical protein
MCFKQLLFGFKIESGNENVLLNSIIYKADQNLRKKKEMNRKCGAES